MPIWHIYQIKTPSTTIYIGLIRDEANELAARRGPLSEVPLIGENLADTTEQAQAVTQATSETTDTTLVESILGGITALRSSRSSPSATMVPLPRVKKHEAPMVTLLHHIHPSM